MLKSISFFRDRDRKIQTLERTLAHSKKVTGDEKIIYTEINYKLSYEQQGLNTREFDKVPFIYRAYIINVRAEYIR
jgi:hypothetical protein